MVFAREKMIVFLERLLKDEFEISSCSLLLNGTWPSDIK